VGGIDPEDTRIGGEAPVSLPPASRRWSGWMILGGVFWIAALILWAQEGVDQRVLFLFDPQRASVSWLVHSSCWLSSYGLASLSAIGVLCVLTASRFRYLDLPPAICLYVLCSLAVSGIAGDLLKLLIARPRPAMTYAGEIVALAEGITFSLPSGHTAKSVAIVLPFLVLIAGWRWQQAMIKGVIAVIVGGVCFSRLVLGAHYVSDVLAGVGMAFVGFPFSAWLASRMLRNVSRKRVPMLVRVWVGLFAILAVVFALLGPRDW